MEGPLSGDQGCRITVLHNGQVQQCSHCLMRANFCPGGGNGRACERLKTPRGKLADYMKYLKEKHNYTSLKMQYLQMQFPALGGHRDSEDGFGHIEEVGEEQESTSRDKDMEIEGLKKELSDQHFLQQQLVEAQAKIRIEKNIARTATKKLEHVEKVASQRIVESMPGANFEDDSNHLAMLLATVLEKDDFQYDLVSDKVEPKAATEFLQRITDHCANVPDKEAKLNLVKNKVLEKMKRTLRRERKLSVSESVCSISSISSSRTRQRSEGDEAEREHAAKLGRHLKPPANQSRLPAPVNHQI